MLRPSIIATSAALAVAGLSACGGTASDEERVRGVALAFMTELAEGDANACERLSDDGRRQLESRAELLGLDGCEALVVAVRNEYSDADRAAIRQLRIRRVSVKGDRATVRDRDVTVPDELDGQLAIDDRPLILRKHGADWKIEDLG